MSGAPAHVVLDTNAILLPFTDGTDLEGELQRLAGVSMVVVPTCVLMELDQISRRGDQVGRAAKMAKKYATRFKTEETRLTGDDGILEVARRLGAAVATNDRVLQAECVRSGLQVIVSREIGRLSWRRSGS